MARRWSAGRATRSQRLGVAATTAMKPSPTQNPPTHQASTLTAKAPRPPGPVSRPVPRGPTGSTAAPCRRGRRPRCRPRPAGRPGPTACVLRDPATTNFHKMLIRIQPHPEEHAEGVRLEGWDTPRLLPTLRDAALRAAPQGEVVFEPRIYVTRC